jgi:RpiB/LacA/LacB family sugar-phosphate isomerase
VRVAIGADHAGYRLKSKLIEELDRVGHDLIDVGTTSPEATDYPDFAEAVALCVIEHRADRGIMICGSGLGASVAANKIPGIRAGLCHDAYSARR